MIKSLLSSFPLVFFVIFIHASVIAVESDTLDFDSFVANYGRSYLKGSDEYKIRHQIFQENVERQQWLNMRRDSLQSAVYGINSFSDLTNEEFKNKYMVTYGDTPDGTRCSLLDPVCKTNDDAPPLPDHWDWRSKGVVTSVKNQKQCGSCWAFAAVESVESHWAARHHHLYDLSVQQALDCTPHCSCKGGSPNAAFRWMMKNPGKLILSSDYPYKARQKSCPSLKSTPVKVANFSCCGISAQNEFTQLRAILHQHGPFTVVINAIGLKDYVSGVVQHHCVARSTEYHTVVVVGYDVRGDIPHWIVRNSWGASFGENGYFRLVMGKNICGMGNLIAYPIVA